MTKEKIITIPLSFLIQESLMHIKNRNRSILRINMYKIQNENEIVEKIKGFKSEKK